MNSRTRLLLILAGLVFVALFISFLFLSAGKPPVALVHVVDATGKPVVGAVLVPEGLRTKSGPFSADWYSWSEEYLKVPNDPVITDEEGFARIPYPTYVFERIETGVIIPSINHPDYVPDRPELVVTTRPPAGAPWQAWVDFAWKKIQRKSLIARTDTVILKTGAILRISLHPDSKAAMDTPLFAQIAKGNARDTNFWSRLEPGLLETRRLASGPQSIRVFRVSPEGAVWFSDIVDINAVSGQTNELIFGLKRGVTVRGQLDERVPRPVKNGRVVAHVWRSGIRPLDSPQWHAWTTNREDGTFEFADLPAGDLEIVALCQGFVSTNSPGTAGFRHPQKHLLGTNTLFITVGMEPTARLEVLVTDDKGTPLQDAKVMTWPNVRYGDWSAVVLMSDLYNTSDRFLEPETKRRRWSEPVPDLEATTDSAGLAVFANLPTDVKEFVVEHSQFVLPAITRAGGGRKERTSSVSLISGETNRVKVQLEPRDDSPITHY